MLLDLYFEANNECVVSLDELKRYKYYKKAFKKDKKRIEKNKFLYDALKPILDKIEEKNRTNINKYVEGCVPLRNLFIEI